MPNYPFQKSGPDFRSLGVEGDGEVAVVPGRLEVPLGSLPGIGDSLGATELDISFDAIVLNSLLDN